MRSRAEPVSNRRYDQGESPRWDGRTGELVWVDMINGLFLVGGFDRGRLIERSRVRVGSSMGVAAPLVNSEEGWICAREGGFVHLSVHGAMTTVADGVASPGTQMNDGACDDAGRFWAGTQSLSRTADAALYSLGTDGSVDQRLDHVTVSNGLGFTADGTGMYYVDTLPDRSLERFDVHDGVLRDRRTLAAVPGGNPDGIAVDVDDFVWIAVWDAGEVRRYAPDGALVDVITLTAARPSAVCLWDATLVITTARIGLENPTDDDGRLFAVDVEVPGRPAAPWRPDPSLRRRLGLAEVEAV